VGSSVLQYQACPTVLLLLLRVLNVLLEVSFISAGKSAEFTPGVQYNYTIHWGTHADLD